MSPQCRQLDDIDDVGNHTLQRFRHIDASLLSKDETPFKVEVAKPPFKDRTLRFAVQGRLGMVRWIDPKERVQGLRCALGAADYEQTH